MVNQLNQLLAQVPSPLGDVGTGPGFGPFSNNPDVTGGGGPLIALTKIMSLVIGMITVSAGIYFIFQFLIGATQWMYASGDKSKLQAAQDRLNHALTGIVIVVATYSIVAIVGGILDFDILLENPCQIIEQLGGKC